jgi:hypothetical protein
MLELFSARPEALEPRDGAILTPIPFDGEVASLSAILLDESYAAWIRAGRTEVEGVSILTATHLIPLKARAWIDLTARVLAGQRVDSADIRKHRNDVFRLVAVIEPGVQLDAPKTIRDDMDTFLKKVSDEAVDLKAMGLGTMLMGEAVEMLRGVYRTA